MQKLLVVTFVVFLATAASVMAAEKDDFDRLDGHGASGKRVDVIEWEGNLEIHVYPAGSLAGLALKIDRKNKDKPVMVIGYRFDNQPAKQLVRRAILSIPLMDGFQTYRDPSSGGEYDKIVISNHDLPRPLMAFKLDPEPKQLYPDGHPALLASDQSEAAGTSMKTASRKPAAIRSQESAKGTQREILKAPEEGTIRPFSW